MDSSPSKFFLSRLRSVGVFIHNIFKTSIFIRRSFNKFGKAIETFLAKVSILKQRVLIKFKGKLNNLRVRKY